MIEKAVERQRAQFNEILELVLMVSNDFSVNIVRTGPRDKRLMQGMETMSAGPNKNQRVKMPKALLSMFDEKCDGDVTIAELFLKFKELYRHRVNHGLEMEMLPITMSFPVAPECNPDVFEALTTSAKRIRELQMESIDYINMKPMYERIATWLEENYKN